MNQSKFKFGDMVCEKVNTLRSPFVIRWMHLIDNQFYYWSGNEGEMPIAEEHLELYQEPQKKKLYAWKHKTKRYVFTDTEVAEDDLFNECERSPEYDIEYPTKE